MAATRNYARQSDPDENRQFRRQWDGGCRIDPAPRISTTKTKTMTAEDERFGLAIFNEWRRRQREVS